MKVSAEVKRKYRLKKAIKSILENHLNESYFITLTFNDYVMKNTTKQERLNLIKRYLNNQTDKYILNCDYGKQNGREHYHALSIATDKYINFDLYNAKYGVIYVIPMNKYKYQSVESKINHLLNHSLKDTTDGKIIYSRAKRENHEKKNKKRYYSSRIIQRRILENYGEESRKQTLEELKQQEREQLRAYANKILSFRR